MDVQSLFLINFNFENYNRYLNNINHYYTTQVRIRMFEWSFFFYFVKCGEGPLAKSFIAYAFL